MENKAEFTYLQLYKAYFAHVSKSGKYLITTNSSNTLFDFQRNIELGRFKMRDYFITDISDDDNFGLFLMGEISMAVVSLPDLNVIAKLNLGDDDNIIEYLKFVSNECILFTNQHIHSRMFYVKKWNFKTGVVETVYEMNYSSYSMMHITDIDGMITVIFSEAATKRTGCLFLKEDGTTEVKYLIGSFDSTIKCDVQSHRLLLCTARTSEIMSFDVGIYDLSTDEFTKLFHSKEWCVLNWVTDNILFCGYRDRFDFVRIDGAVLASFPGECPTYEHSNNCDYVWGSANYEKCYVLRISDLTSETKMQTKEMKASEALPRETAARSKNTPENSPVLKGTEMKERLLKDIKKSIASWDKKGIYAVSLFVYDDGDNPCSPTVTLGYNTDSNYESEIKNAYDEAEAKWNYAFWLQNEKLVFGMDASRKIVEKWLKDNSFPCYDSDAAAELSSEELDEVSETITPAFVQVLVEIVQELHSSGFIREQFGNEVPVLIHELEYYDEIAQQNIEANSYEIVKDFVSFCEGT